jgi:hypothetical protein
LQFCSFKFPTKHARRNKHARRACHTHRQRSPVLD